MVVQNLLGKTDNRICLREFVLLSCVLYMSFHREVKQALAR